jgi:hypothetical protein
MSNAKIAASLLTLWHKVAIRREGLARLAADAGYADQAHLTRECGVNRETVASSCSTVTMVRVG